MRNAHDLSRRQLMGAGSSASLIGVACPAISSPREEASQTSPLTLKGLEPEGIVFESKDECLRITIGVDSVSVVRYRPPAPQNVSGFFTPPTQKIKLEDSANGWRLKSGDWRIEVMRKTGALGLYRNDRLIMSDEAEGPANQVFRLAKASNLYGLGQFRDPLANYRDRRIYLAQGNMDAVNPTLVSPDGWGIIWDTGTHAYFTSADETLRFDTPDGALARYHLLAGPGIDGVIGAYRGLTGKAPLLGKYAYGFWQSQERYRTQTELTAMVDGYRARKLPLDVIVQDWRYWGESNLFSGMVWDKASFPDPKRMVDHVHKQHAHIIASVWPAFGSDSMVFKALDKEGLLFKGAHWSGGRVLDITSDKARDIYWQHIDEGMMSVGLDGLWTDGCEPEFMSTGSRYVTTQSYLQNGMSAAGPIKDHLLTFSYYQTQKLYTEAKKAYPAKRPLILTRSVYVGQQAFNAVTWSGDIFAGWETLKNQILASQQITLSGIPYWTNDIGAFLVTHRFEGGLKNPAYRELYVRWFQWAAFLPIFRAHGTEIRREVWAMQDADAGNDEAAYQALTDALRQRYALMPYVYSQAARVTFKNESFLRPLIMDYAADPKIADYPHQYSFGRDLMIAPVTTPLLHAPENRYEFIPNWAVSGIDGSAAEVEFFEGSNFERSVAKRRSDDLKMSWSGDLPVELAGKPYSARWKGFITATESGLHKFSIVTQGLIRFSLDGVVKVASAGVSEGVANKADGGVSFKGHTGDDSYRFEMSIEKGRSYLFELTQSQPKPDVVSLWVEWETPSIRAAMQTPTDKVIDIYLPAGQDWYALGKMQKLKGGTLLKHRPALNELPVFVRAGAIIPMTPGIQYADAPVAETELHIYAGRDGAFELYDDAGDGHGYEQGEHALTPIVWKDKVGKLTVGPIKGRYPGMATERRFTVTIYRDGQTFWKALISMADKAVHIII